MLAIFGEDQTDHETLKIIARKILRDDSLAIKGRGYSGGEELLRNANRDIGVLQSMGWKAFVICIDSDSNTVQDRLKEVQDKISSPLNTSDKLAVVVPVEELESWLLADMAAVGKLFTGWKGCSSIEHSHPEHIKSPKENLRKLSEKGQARPRYADTKDNAKIARHLCLKTLHRKCPSYRVFEEFILRQPWL